MCIYMSPGTRRVRIQRAHAHAYVHIHIYIIIAPTIATSVADKSMRMQI